MAASPAALTNRFRLLQSWLLLGATVLVNPSESFLVQSHDISGRRQRNCFNAALATHVVSCSKRSQLFLQQRDHDDHHYFSIYDPDDRAWLNHQCKSQQANVVQTIRTASNATQVMDALVESSGLSPTRLTYPVAAAALRTLAVLDRRNMKVCRNNNDDEAVTAGAAACRQDHDNDQSSIRVQHELLQAIYNHVMEDANGALDDDQEMRLYSQYALADTLAAMAMLQQKQRNETLPSDTADSHTRVSSYLPNSSLHDLGNRIWSLLFDDYDAPLPSPKRLANCLLASDKLGLLDTLTPQKLMTLDRLHHRLAQGDAMGELSGPTLVRLLFLALRQTRHMPTYAPTEAPLLRVLARRLRKESVRNTLSTHQLMLVLRGTVVATLAPWSNDAEMEAQLVEELNVMVYTLIRHEALKRIDLSPSQSTDLLQIVMKMHLPWEDVVVQQIMTRMKTLVYSSCPTSAVWLQQSASMLEALAYWRQDFDTGATFLHVGETLREDIRADAKEATRNVRHVNSLLRSAVLLHRRDATTIAPYVALATQLIAYDDKFLQGCRASEVVNLAWFLLRGRLHEHTDMADELVNKLAYRLLQEDAIIACTPKLASRIISSFTDLFALQAETRKIVQDDGSAATGSQVLLSQLFDAFGSHLLSVAALSPAELSSCIHAIAKASYTSNRGIFDCLMEEFTQRLYAGATVRQATQCLLACAKMMAWEDDDFVEIGTPPYSQHAHAFCRFIVQEHDSLSSQDVSQALWSVARLRIVDKSLIDPLFDRAKTLAGVLSMQEIAGILSAMNKLDYKQYDVVYAITRRLANTSEIRKEQPSPQECSVILHSLAWMDIRDDAIYEALTQCMLAQIDQTNAQAVATVLWAHETVHISPPQLLLNKYANVKLGMAPAVRRNSVQEAW
ncbi:hypothetical protein MPSEU_001054000 [Mayamaea pseudoterrestris]|nr:hypothetical protein MPSEU_001054000 [Mayamaea pseudoterrestris]